jgi:hypothetical protein
MSLRRGVVVGACLVLDVLVVVLLAAILVSLALGGIEFEAASVRVRLTSLTNPTLFAALALAARYALRRHLPFLGVPAFGLERATTWGVLAAGRYLTRDAITPRVAWSVVGGLSVLAVVVKLACAWFLPGFFSGDDVEIHEMTLSALYGLDLPVWELRNSFFPLAFIYPAQWLADSIGLDQPRHLVFAGRSVVVLLSTAAVALTWVAAKRAAPEHPLVALVSASFVAFNKVQMSFGSSELPRPVATVLVLGAFILLLSANRRWSALAGVLLGLAAAFRFSELVFVLPAALSLASESRWQHLVLFSASLIATLAIAIGVTDYAYWGTPFSSLWSAVDYTLVDRASSRGYEPVFAYLILVPQWTNWIVFLLAMVGAWHGRLLGYWMLIPIAVLSLLPHKETRYLVPVVPYACIAAAVGLGAVAKFVRREHATWRAQAIATLLPPLLVLGILQDAGGWRLRRSNEEVRLASWLRSQGPGGVALRHVWRAGGGVYLSGNRPLVDIEDQRFDSTDGRREMFKDVRWLVVDAATAQRMSENEIQARGFRFVRPWGERLRVYSKD